MKKNKLTRDIPLPSSDGLFPNVKGRALSKTKVAAPKAKPTGEQRAAVTKAAEKSNKIMSNSDEKMFKKKQNLARGFATSVAAASIIALDRAIKNIGPEK
jgi:hypothetical protein